MIHDRIKYTDRVIIKIGMTPDHPIQSDNFIFFADPHFLFFSNHSIGKFVFCLDTQSHLFGKSNEPYFPNAHKENKIKNINLKFNNYGNN